MKSWVPRLLSSALVTVGILAVGIQIGDGQGRIKNSTFRIGHVGYLTDEEIDYFTRSFEICLRSLIK